MKKNIIIIGAGFAGLSAAALLSAQGHSVHIIENNKEVGGRARLWEEKGYKFDMGPSWYLMPEVFDKFFKSLGKDISAYYKLDRLKKYYKVFFEGQDSILIDEDLEKTKAVFESFEKGGGTRLDEYMKKAQYKYDTAMDQFLYKEYRSIFQFFNWKVMVEGLRLNIFASLDGFVRKYFTDVRARQLLEYAMVFLGSSPQNAPALYSIMSHVDLKLGVWFPKGGMNGVAKALETLAREGGAQFTLGTDVKKIIVENKRAVGVLTDQGLIKADVVINSGDYPWGETELLDLPQQTYKKSYWEKKVIAPSMFIVYLGIGKKLPNLEHHNLYFSKDWDQHFDQIFKNPGWPENPCFYLSAISQTDPSMAPKGCENLFLLIPLAAGLEETEEIKAQYLEKALTHVETVTGESFRDHIQVQRIFSMGDFKKDYHAYKGTALGLSHTLFQTAIFRPGHKSKKVKNLYYTGQYTHPGVGVPMTLIASEILVKEMEKEWQS